MIIRISKKRKYKLLFSIILICGVMSCAPVKTDSETYKSSAELNDRGEVTKYKGTAIIAEIIRNTSNEKSRTGTASVKLDSIHKYGFKTKVINLNKGEFVRVSIWQHNSYEQGSFSCVVKCGESKKVMKSASFAITGQNWIKRTHEIYVEADNTTLDFYVFTGGNTAYFDDLTIQKYSSVPVDTTASDLRQLHLVISEKSEKKIRKV